ncbi:MAG: redoxin domain-containing protein [Pyrinomonadaceae bacterium]|nr:redoxin domain-containing protein [Pyrinomonadaceae bacterium]
MIIKVAATLLIVAALSHPAALWQQTSMDKKRVTPVAVGEVAPDFTLEDQDGRKITLAAERGKRPIVLVFYRGYW